MRQTTTKCLALGLLGLIIGAGSAVGQDAGSESTIQVRVEPITEPQQVKVDACASDPARLGLSRIVEIDTAGGPHLGGSHGGDNAFLEDGEVVLTFDDGPMRAYTRTILKALADHCTKATFFMVGRMAVADPDMVKEVAAAGHTIASHTMTHKNLGVLGLMRGRQELEAAISAITKANGAPIAPFFRFPYLSGSRTVDDYTRSRDIATVWIDVDSKDYFSRDPRGVHNRIMSQLATKRKGIILMHDIQISTVRAIGGLLDALHEKGYRVVHMVPKSGLSTLAEFDAGAEKAMAAKAARSGSSPLANRSVTWTTEPDPETEAETDGEPAKRPRRAKRLPPKPVQPDENLPWSAMSSNDPAPQPKKKPSKAKQEELPWQLNILNF